MIEPRPTLPVFAILRHALADVRAVFWKLVPLAVVPALPAAFFTARLECDAVCVPMEWWDQNQLLSAFDLVLGAPAAVAAIRLLARRDATLRSAVFAAVRRWSSSGEIRLVVGLMISIAVFLPAIPVFLALPSDSGAVHVPLVLLGAIVAIPLATPVVGVMLSTVLALPALAIDQPDSNRALVAARFAWRGAFWRVLALIAVASLPELGVEAVFDLGLTRLVGGFWSDFAVVLAELTLAGLAGAFFLAAMGEAYLFLRARDGEMGRPPRD